MKRILTIAVLLLAMTMPGHAVLQERDLKTTIAVLRNELETNYHESQDRVARYDQMNESQHKQIVATMQKSDEISLMLYSQQPNYTFDLAYACDEATQQYRDFQFSRQPYTRMVDKLTTEIARYQSLITTLENIPPMLNKPNMPAPPPMRPGGNRPPAPKDKSFMLDSAGQANRAICIAYAKAILVTMQNLKANIIQDNVHYVMVQQRLKKSNDYAQKRYAALQKNIFVNGDDSYLSILKRLPRRIQRAKMEVNDKYSETKTSKIHSEWRGPVVIGLVIFVFFYLIVAGILGNIIVRLLVPKRFRTPEFEGKKACLIMVVAVFLFSIAVMFAMIFMHHHFLQMATGLLIEFAWLLGAILVSLLVRLKANQIKAGVRAYTPMIMMGFLIISFRIVFIPNDLINIIFFPLMVLFTVWQWFSIRKFAHQVPKADSFYAWITFAVMAVSCVCSWKGFTLLAVQIFIWWLFQLAFVQTITCCYHLLEKYETKYLEKKVRLKKLKQVKRGMERRIEKGETITAVPKVEARIDLSDKKNKGNYIGQTWLFDLINMCIVPISAVYSLFFCIVWAASMFDLTEAVITVYFYNFINVPDVLQLSLFKITVVCAAYFLFRYFNYLVKALYRRHCMQKADVVNGQANLSLVNNLTSIFIWGVFFIMALFMLQVPKSGISIVTAGLATGIGFAMKDLLENFFYGMSLMTGRVRVGDWIECDGIRGKVESVTYQSTQVLTNDGCIIAFLNSSLFNKNFKNLTRNHGYELTMIPVGVAYGTDVNKVREMLRNAISLLMERKPDGRENILSNKGVSVAFQDFGDNCVNLNVVYWVLVEDKFWVNSKVKETIYNVLNENHIEIPFPQRDVHIIKQD